MPDVERRSAVVADFRRLGMTATKGPAHPAHQGKTRVTPGHQPGPHHTRNPKASTNIEI
jgi:hypothetical protein